MFSHAERIICVAAKDLSSAENIKAAATPLASREKQSFKGTRLSRYDGAEVLMLSSAIKL